MLLNTSEFCLLDKFSPFLYNLGTQRAQRLLEIKQGDITMESVQLFFTELVEVFKAVDVSGIEEMIYNMFSLMVNNFDIRTVDTTTIAELLTKYSAIWNPIWEMVNKFLAAFANF